MNLRRLIKATLLLIFFCGLAYGIFYAWRAVPVITGYSAKNMCSCVLLAGRDPGNVRQFELGKFPLSLASVEVDRGNSSATASLFGLARRTAIYRKGLGCSLAIGVDADDLRSPGVSLPAPPRVNQDTIAWPDGNLTSPLGKNIKLEQVLDSAFAEPGPDKLRRTRAVIVVYNGNIVAERYAPPFTRDTKMMGWSMTKSLTNALVGILVKDGRLRLEDRAPVATWLRDDRKRITLNDLMHANSGLDWEENYGAPSWATKMLFNTKDMGVFAATARSVHEPGKIFYYSSGTTNIISRIVRETLGDEAYYRFPYERLFYKTGMLGTVIEADAGGTFVGSSYSYAPARDWARFGLLYLNDGIWNGERILPEGWVDYSTTPARGADRGQYGAQFWLNAGQPGNTKNRSFPSVPTDLFWAEGFEGQNVFILPSKKLVVVKLGLTQGDDLDDNKFLSGIIEALAK